MLKVYWHFGLRTGGNYYDHNMCSLKFVPTSHHKCRLIFISSIFHLRLLSTRRFESSSRSSSFLSFENSSDDSFQNTFSYWPPGDPGWFVEELQGGPPRWSPAEKPLCCSRNTMTGGDLSWRRSNKMMFIYVTQWSFYLTWNIRDLFIQKRRSQFSKLSNE